MYSGQPSEGSKGNGIKAAPSNLTSRRLELVRERVQCATLRDFWREITKDAGYRVSYEAVRNYHNDRDPPVDYLVRVADVFGVDLHWLATGRGAPWPADPSIGERAREAGAAGTIEFEQALREVFWQYETLPPLAIAAVLKTCDRLHRDAAFRTRISGKTTPTRPYIGRFVGKALAGPLVNAVAGSVHTSDLHPWQMESYVLALCQGLAALIPNPNWTEVQLQQQLH